MSSQGVENVYAQHVPLMMTTVEAALKGKLKDSTYPAVGSSGGKSQEVRVSGCQGIWGTLCHCFQDDDHPTLRPCEPDAFHFVDSHHLLPNHATQVIVFMVGGVTYEEACKVAELNASLPSGNVVLGGSFVHNSTSFLEELNLSFGRASQERDLGTFR